MEPHRSFTPKGALLRRQCAQLKLREHYMQRDAALPCVHGRARASLPDDAAAPLVVPSPTCVTHLLPVLAALPLPPQHELIILQTALKAALDAASRQQQLKLKTFLLESPSAPRRVLLNECTPLLFSGQRHHNGETAEEHQLRLFVDACLFLARAGRPVTVLVCDVHDPLHAAMAEVGVGYTTLAAYIAALQESSSASSSSVARGQGLGQGLGQGRDAWANLAVEADELLLHLRAQQLPPSPATDTTPSVPTVSQAKRQRFPAHLDPPTIRAGLADGSLQRGRFFVFKHDPREGHVEAQGAGGGGGDGGPGVGAVVMVSGGRDMNRALDGDDVVVRVHPRGRWRRAAAGEVTLSDPSAAAAGAPYARLEVRHCDVQACQLIATALHLPPLPRRRHHVS